MELKNRLAQKLAYQGKNSNVSISFTLSYNGFLWEPIKYAWTCDYQITSLGEIILNQTD